MKPLDKLNNVERAKLLHELFPEEIPGSIQCIKAIADAISNDPADILYQWDNQLFSADFWIKIAEDTKKRIEKYSKQLTKSSRFFSDQLFDGYNALFTIHCLQQYINTADCTSKPFAKAVEMLFG